ncbi:penicillin acylase family protein [Leifsonia sp. RAF41]|uniref:penicillin acylase family protein n=1 Tax=Leifsonia sp. RAF41 TaxID=3233056 RepID=UPI003F97A8A3
MVDVEEIPARGLDAPVEIIIDQWGVPHIYADSDKDLYFAQGFNAARDRLFQIDTWRRRGLGLVSAVLGEAHIEQDAAARAFLYAGDPDEDLRAYGRHAKGAVESFVAGINAYIALTRSDPSLLPPEFALVGYQPDTWETTDISRIRTHGLFYNAEYELARALTLRDHGGDVERLRATAEPPIELTLPRGLDASALSAETLQQYRLAFARVMFGTTNTKRREAEPGGSNNWVIGPSRTTTGRPILANDPHRAMDFPSLRYIAHLVSPETDLIGAGEPALPGISIGHTQEVAFGLTIFPLDQEDLIVYETHPDDPHLYRWADGWEAMSSRTERIPVLGQPDRVTQLWFTRHGPVIDRDRTRNVVIALRAAWLEPGMAPYLASIEYSKASNAAEFLDALKFWGAPGANQLFATTEGRIGWRPSAAVPQRRGWEGSTPVPGDGSHEWDGVRRDGILPTVIDPTSGWLATANQFNLPEDSPVVGHDWSSDSRYRRIAQMLDQKANLSVADCVRMQTDYQSLPAVEMIEIISEAARNNKMAPEWELIAEWDGEMSAGSVAATIFEIWMRRHLRPRLLGRQLATTVDSAQLESALQSVLPDETWSSDTRVVQALLRREQEQDSQGLIEVVNVTLAAAIREIEALLGQDKTKWSWGSLHKSAPRHALADLDNAPAWTTLGPEPRGGSGDTVNYAPYGSDFVQTSGASFRIVMDVGDWDQSRAMNMPGQSGDPRNKHFTDLYEPWLADQSFPLLYSRSAIEHHAESRIRLIPPQLASTPNQSDRPDRDADEVRPPKHDTNSPTTSRRRHGWRRAFP